MPVAAAVAAKNCRGVAIYTSDFKRAAETAETVHAALRADGVAVWPADGPRREVLLRERWFGEFDGGADSERGMLRRAMGAWQGAVVARLRGKA